MAIATGAAIALGVGAAASAYGAHKQGQAGKAAAAASEKGTSEALAFEREQAAKEEARYNEQQALQKMQWEAAQSNKRALMRRYGLNPAEPSGGMTLGGLAGFPPPATAGPGGPPMSPEMAAEPPPMPPGMNPQAPVGPRGRTLGDIENWNDWRRYAPIQ